MDPFRERRKMEISWGMLSIRVFNGLVGKTPHYVTLRCSYWPLKRKIIGVVKMFVLLNDLLTEKEKMDNIIFEKHT